MISSQHWKWKRFFLILLVFNLTIGCHNDAQPEERQTSINVYTNILNYTGVPDSVSDRSVFVFSDLGAWHGYAMPTKNHEEYIGSFSGPFLMTQDNGVWVSDCLSRLKVFDLANNRVIDLSDSEKIDINSYPNRLEQKINVRGESLIVHTQIQFVTSRSAIIQANISNMSEEATRELSVHWEGKSMLSGVRFSLNMDQVMIHFENNQNVGSIRTDLFDDQVQMQTSRDAYSIQQGKTVLKPQQTLTTHISQTFCFSEEEMEKEHDFLTKIMRNPAGTFRKRNAVKNTQIATVESLILPEFDDQSHRNIAVKCVQTLNGNWRSAAGFLKHDGLFPSYHYLWFNGFWAWDSWKHAVALAYYDTNLAQEQILAMFDFQDEMGMIPDCVYRDTLIENHNWRDTKPPLSAWATWSVFESSGDENFLTEILPKIEKYHNWWYQYRDIDQNGLCEYGSTDGSLVAAKWESGMDNAVRFDDAKMVKNKLGGSMDRESVDLNAYLFSEKEYLSKILAQLGNSKKAEQYKVEAEELKAQIQELFFDEESGWYYDISLESKKHLKTFGAEGWIPLWAKVATEKQAVLIHQKMTDTALFATYIPFPTLAANHPDFKPDRGYWRGPVWLDQAYFAIQGLRNYGINDDALLFTHQLFDRLQGLKDNDLPIRENYHPLTGEGMESQHFSWSAAHLLMLLIEQ